MLYKCYIRTLTYALQASFYIKPEKSAWQKVSIAGLPNNF